jgi:hypothetical protein
MILEYLQFKTRGKKNVKIMDNEVEYSYDFNPTGEVLDRHGEKILEVLRVEFKRVGSSTLPTNKPKCEICGYEGKNLRAVTLHKTAKHKEIKK